MEKRLSILIADDHRLFRQGLHMILNQMDDVESVYEACNGEDVLSVIETTNIDIVLMDISMPIMNGLDATIEIKNKFPKIKIIALSMYDDQETYYNMINAGVNGFILKESGANELKSAIRSVHANENFFSQELLRRIIIDISKQVQVEREELRTKNIISDREQEIIYYVTKGMSSKDISEILHISRRTVENHKANIYRKTKCKNSSELIFFAIKNKLISIS